MGKELICCVVVVYPEVSFAFHRERHTGVFSQRIVHLHPQTTEADIQHTYPPPIFLRSKRKKFSYVVEEADPGRNVDLLLDPEGVPGIRIEVYRYVDFGLVGYSLHLCRSWGRHWTGTFGGGGG